MFLIFIEFLLFAFLKNIYVKPINTMVIHCKNKCIQTKTSVLIVLMNMSMYMSISMIFNI